MSIEPSRRSFLIGMGSLTALAAVKIPALAQGALTSLGSSGLLIPGDRAVYDLIISGFSNGGLDQTIRHLNVKRMRDPASIMAINLHPFAMMRWVAVPDGEITLLPDDLLLIDVEPACANGTVSLYFKRNGRKYGEVYDWRGNDRIKSKPIPLDGTCEGMAFARLAPAALQH